LITCTSTTTREATTADPYSSRTWSRKDPFIRGEIYTMACQANEAGLMMLEYTSRNGHYVPSQYTHQDLNTIVLTRKGLGREHTYPPKGYKLKNNRPVYE